MAWLCDFIALACVLLSDVTHVPGRFLGIFRESELTLMQHRKVTLPQGDLQINDQGWRLSAGLHASCPIHHQTWQGTLPLGIWGIFMEHFRHFYLMPIGSKHWSSPAERKQKQSRDLGCGGWRSSSLTERLLIHTWATSHRDRVAHQLLWQPPYSSPPSCSCAAGH